MDYSDPHFLAGLQRSVLTNLRSNGYNVGGRLFPITESKANGTHMFRNQLGSTGWVMGQTQANSMDFQNRAIKCPGNTENVFVKNADIDVVRVGLHETAHTIIKQDRMNDTILQRVHEIKGITPPPPGMNEASLASVYMGIAINESMTDAVAVKAMLSKFGGDPRIEQYVENLSKMRAGAMEGKDLSHPANGMIDLVLNDWRNNGKVVNPNYTLLDASKDVRKILEPPETLSKVADTIARDIMFPTPEQNKRLEAGQMNQLGDEKMFHPYMEGVKPTTDDLRARKTAAITEAETALCIPKDPAKQLQPIRP